MDLIDIRKKAKEAKAAKEALVEETSAPDPASVEKPAAKRAGRRKIKAAVQAIATAETGLLAEGAPALEAPSPPDEAPTRRSAPPSSAGGGYEEMKAGEAPAVPEASSSPAAVEGRKETEVPAAPAVQAETETSGMTELLAFMLADEEYALKMGEAREIIRWRKPTKVPRAPEYIIGIISLRGVILPVFDVKKRLGLGEMNPSRHTRIIVVSEGGSLCGMVVDRITGVASVPEKGVESPPAVIDGNEAEYIEGVGRAGDRLLILIRTSRVLSA